MNSLSQAHRRELEASAISSEVIAERGYRTISDPRDLPGHFTGAQRRLDGLVIPIANTQGEIVSHQLKPRNPRTFDKRIAKYEFAKAGVVCLDVPAQSRGYLDNSDVDLWITEGAKKVDSGLSNGLPCIIGVQGVWMWQQRGVALPDWRDIQLRDRTVIIAFDSDVMVTDSVRQALTGLSSHLQHCGATVKYCLLPGAIKNEREGERR